MDAYEEIERENDRFVLIAIGAICAIVFLTAFCIL